MTPTFTEQAQQAELSPEAKMFLDSLDPAPYFADLTAPPMGES